MLGSCSGLTSKPYVIEMMLAERTLVESQHEGDATVTVNLLFDVVEELLRFVQEPPKEIARVPELFRLVIG